MRYRTVDAIRGAAALVVALAHSYQFPWPGIYGVEPPWPALNLLWYLGNFAVAAFIATSGFCLMLPVLQNDELTLTNGVKNFFSRRFLRVFPPHFFCLAICVLLIWSLIGTPTHTHWDVSLPVTTKAFFAHLFLVNNFFPDVQTKINGVFWSIALEWQLYFIFPLFLWLVRTCGIVVSLLVSIVGTYFLDAALTASPYAGTRIHLLFAFISGACGAICLRRFAKIPQFLTGAGGVILIVLLTLFIVALIQFQPFIGLDTLRFSELVIGVITSALLIRMIKNEEDKRQGPLVRRLVIAPLATLGIFSYSIYLMHFPLLQVFWQLTLMKSAWSDQTRYAILMLIEFPIILALCRVFYLLFELPFIKAMRKYR